MVLPRSLPSYGGGSRYEKKRIDLYMNGYDWLREASFNDRSRLRSLPGRRIVNLQLGEGESK